LIYIKINKGIKKKRNRRDRERESRGETAKSRFVNQIKCNKFRGSLGIRPSIYASLQIPTRRAAERIFVARLLCLQTDPSKTENLSRRPLTPNPLKNIQ
jgi:hypothetical protein